MQIPFLDLKPQISQLKENILKRVEEVFEHGRFINGPEVTEFEEKLKEYTGAPFALACGNGTEALQLALMALGIGPDDEVIVPNFTFFATSESVNLVGATPVFVDIQLADYNLDTSALDEAYSSKTKAIIPVSLFGQVPEMDAINTWAKEKSITVIEDGAQSFGAEYKGKKSCNLSTLATTSFFPAKPLGTFGDGGAIFTQSEELYSKMRSIREHGQGARYCHTQIGLNARLDSLQCGFLIDKLKGHQWAIERRNSIASKYTENFEKLESKGLFPPKVASHKLSAWAQYTLRFSERDKLIQHLSDKGIPTAIHYPFPLSEQPVYKENTASSRLSSSENSQKASKEVFSIPIYPDTPEEHVNFIIESVKRFFD